jgi:hypothetical protein
MPSNNEKNSKPNFDYGGSRYFHENRVLKLSSLFSISFPKFISKSKNKNRKDDTEFDRLSEYTINFGRICTQVNHDRP